MVTTTSANRSWDWPATATAADRVSLADGCDAIPMKLPHHHTSTGSAARPADRSLNRRQFLIRTATGIGTAALWSALGPRAWAATAGSASDAPESPDMNFGMIA